MRITPGRLPDAYQEVEYIQSSGTQYINTGVYGGSDVTTELVISDQSASTEAVPLGAQGSAYYDKSYYWWTSTLYNRVSCRSNYNENRVNNAFSMGAYKITSDSKTNTIISLPVGAYVPVTGAFNITETYRTDYTMFLFAMNDHGSPSNNCVCKIYSCKVWYDDGDTLVLDLVPCYRISDGVVGMYDLVSETFLTNNGAGTFDKGDDVGVVKEWSIIVNGNSEKVKKVVDGSNNVIWQRLPMEYAEVEYIQSSGTQYINTGFTTSLTMKIEIDAMASGSNDLVLGTMPINMSENSNFTVGCVDTNREYLCWNNAHYYGGYSAWTTRRKMTYYQENGYIIMLLNGSSYSSMSVVSPSLQVSSVLYLFRRNDGGTPSSNPSSIVRVYGCRLWTNNVIQRDFVPCYRRADGVIGMYDLVTKTFFTNAGSGTFTKGNDI